MITTGSERETIHKANDRNIFLRTVGLAFALFLTSQSATAQEVVWPQFRGPDSNPVAANAKLVDRWSKTENVEWSQEIPGRGWSSPIVTGNRVYVTAVTTEGKSNCLLYTSDAADERSSVDLG